MLRLFSSEQRTRGSTLRRKVRSCALASILILSTRTANADTRLALDPGVHLELTPKICTVKADDASCETRVLAQWHAAHDESLCLVIAEKPEVKHCWDHYSHGSYSIELTFNTDLRFELKDPQLRDTMATESLRLIRQALEYRHRRRAPWNVF